MKIYYNRGIKMSERVIDFIEEYCLRDDNRFILSIDVFYNCREQGYKVELHDNSNWKTLLTFWIYCQRNSDEPTITWKRGYYYDQLFDEDSYYNRTISFHTETELEEYIMNMLKDEVLKEGNEDEENED